MTSRTPHAALILLFAGVALPLIPAPAAQATVIGTFSTARNVDSDYDLFSGSWISLARTALAADGHSLVNLDAGINASSLAEIDTVYLPLPSNNAQVSGSVISDIEAQALYDYVFGGNTLIVQGDVWGFGEAYNNLATLFGVQYTHTFGPPQGLDTGIVTLSATFPGLTSGPHGNASSLSVMMTSSLDPGATTGVSLVDTPDGNSFLYVLGPNAGLGPLAGHVVFLTDMNSFLDGGEPDWGFTTADGEVFWRNMFEPIPEPSTALLLAAGLVGLAAAGRIR